MDIWKFFDITHRKHVLCNPMSVEKFIELIDLLRLRSEDRVLEIATGKGEFIIRLAEQYEIEGIGLDISPYHISDAKKKHQQRIPDAQLSFVEMNGEDYKPEERESYDLVIIGASGANTMIKEWIFGNLTQDIVDAVGIPIMVVNQARAANRSKFSN